MKTNLRSQGADLTANLTAAHRPAGEFGQTADEVGQRRGGEALRRLSLKYIALVPGASYRGFHDSIVNYLGNTNPQMVICLHEEHAVSIADGYGKVTEEPMAVALHANVGLLHATMPIFNAWCDCTPMIIFGTTGPVDATALALDRLDSHGQG